jgi:hypothetical protein
LAGGLLWCLLLTVLTSLFLPAGSFLFIWPFFFGLIALASGVLVRHQNPASARLLAVVAVCVVPGALILAPIIYLTLIAVTLRSVTSLLLLALPAALILVLLTPQLQVLTPPSKKAST